MQSAMRGMLQRGAGSALYYTTRRSLNIVSRPSDLVGNTPLIYLDRVTKGLGVKGRIVGKLESLGPCSSVKDRL
eukprot:87591-Pyramimonas_sp.AAC.1